MARNSYDFSLFETHYDNTVRAVEPEVETRPRKKVVAFPKERRKLNAKPKRRPMGILMTVVSFAIFMGLCAGMVLSQQQLAELTDQVNIAAEELTQKESIEVQLKMEAARRMSGAEVETYARDNLGMNKLQNSQITYLSVGTEDAGVVLQNPKEESALDWLINRVKELFS